MDNLPVILVVDDEEIERKMICYILQTKYDRIYRIIEATNGIEAIRVARAEHPHVVVMDVCMPLMDGIVALSEIKLFLPNVYSIILTAHDEFEYAVRAVKIGANDYVLKPARESKLTEAFSRMEKITTSKTVIVPKSTDIDAFTPYIEDSIISAIYMDSYSTEKLRGIITRLFNRENGYFLGCVECNASIDTDAVLQSLREGAKEAGTRVVGSVIGHKLIFLTADSFSVELIKQRISLVISSEYKFQCKNISDPGSCAAVYRDMNYSDSGLSSERISDSFYCDEKGIAIHIGMLERKSAEEMLFSLFMRQKNALGDHESLAGAMERRKAVIDHYLIMTVGEIQLSPTVPLTDFAEGERIKSLLTDYVEVRIRDVEESSSKKQTGMLNDVIQNIEQNYSNSLYSLSRAAEMLNVSSTYLSRIFKEQLGCTFTKYLNDIRVDEAKKRLRDGKDINETAVECGFNSVNYFCTVFKKYTGFSPASYRDRKQFGNRTSEE